MTKETVNAYFVLDSLEPKSGSSSLEPFSKAQLNDDWLYQEARHWHEKPANNYFKWFHVLEGELNQRGQIRLIQ